MGRGKFSGGTVKGMVVMRVWGKRGDGVMRDAWFVEG